MSALWVREPQSLSRSLNVSQTLELRTFPDVYRMNTESATDDTSDIVLTEVYRNSLLGWLYGATIELFESAVTPAWSKDTWSFLPLDMDGLGNAAFRTSGSTNTGLISNATFQTPALCARLECESLDTSGWVTKWDFSNDTLWNSTNRPPGLEYGYTLPTAIQDPLDEWNVASVRGRSRYLTCCANETDGVAGDAAIGYWSSWKLIPSAMVAQWVVGRPLNGTHTPSVPYESSGSLGQTPLWVWMDEPSITAVNCTPIIEQSSASVVVEIGTGAVQSYSILDTPQHAPSAWSDYYVPHDTTPGQITLDIDVTTR